MNVSFEEIGRISATFAVESGAAGQVCKLSANGTVAACAAGDEFCGVLEGARKGYGAVQLHGFVEVGYTGDAPDLGYVNLCAGENGGVQTGGGREYLVVSVDTAKQTAVIEL